jgi:DNA-binding response OmpR family regulator
VSAARTTILLVEVEQEAALALAAQLHADGYDVAVARSATHALALAREDAPALALLGGLDAPRATLALLEQIRGGSCSEEIDRGLPAIVLGRAANELDVLRAFEAGADDFIGPAAGYLEVRARVRALQRRAWSTLERRIVRVGELAIDTCAHTVTLEGREIGLRRMEFDLLVHLAREPHRVFGKQELLRAVWGYRACGTTRTLDSHASRVRRKLDPDGVAHWVVNVWGVGYRLT